ncbi:2,3-bisphosphoglycerate-independent phosphoglycerate mutase [Candidatus Wolfebacteria bacterium]|nr:2,3-bisphosphoglycerate-independent phosphoglycerate mutase [Candidatus Wolfebacteria bacterium]
MKRVVVLIILDGWGIGQNDQSNPVYVVNPPAINYLKENFPFAGLQASGIAAGLPWGEEGNSEIGHLNIGSGKVVYQNYPRISLAIRDNSFFKNETILKAFEHSKKNNSAVNLIGLLSDGVVHSAFEHLEALIKFAQIQKIDNLNIHLITDGRDSSPTSSLEILSRLPPETKKNIASISGRFFSMDRDKNWDRIKKYYDIITNEGAETKDFENYIKNAHKQGYSDEYISPILVDSKKIIKENDAIIFFNFREDRMRQIAETFIDKNFSQFQSKKFSNLFVVQMISYSDKFIAPVAFPKEIIADPLSKIIADAGKIQFKIAETEKYAHITYFFNGENEAPFKNEYRVLIPSRKELNHASHPEMMANEITSRVIEAINEGTYDFIVANYANPDIIAHTGNYDASLEAVKTIDRQIDKITKTVLDKNAILIITSDHGNIERMFDPTTGEPETKHDPSPVPIHLVTKEFKYKKDALEIKKSEKSTIGILADIAPTILEIMGLPKSKEMTGQSLLKLLT